MFDPNNSMKVGVILPAHNEAELIAGVVAGLPDWVQHIIVVDDCSSDNTCQIVEDLSDPRVTLVKQERNTGVGGAMVTGYRTGLEMGCDILVKMDADGQMDVSDLPNIVTPIVEGLAEYVKGNRFYVINANRSMPQARKFGSIGLTFMTKMASGYWHVFDSQCGFTAVRTRMLRMVDLDRIAADYFFENDMLIWMNTVGAKTIDVPVKTVYGNEVSGVNIGRILSTFPPRLLRGWLFRVNRKYLLTDFGAIGALGVFGTFMSIFGGAFGLAHLVEANITGVATTTGTVMIAVLPLIIGIQCLLQAFTMEVADSSGADETREYVHRLIDSGEFE